MDFFFQLVILVLLQHNESSLLSLGHRLRQKERSLHAQLLGPGINGRQKSHLHSRQRRCRQQQQRGHRADLSVHGIVQATIVVIRRLQLSHIQPTR